MKKLLSSYPHLVKEWHPTKNGDLTPNDFTHGTKKKVWWICPKGHSYESAVVDRTKTKPTGCYYCAGKKVSEENSLLKVFPEVAKEWHPTKNKELTPNQVTRGSKKEVWWLCPKGHSYESTINHRTVMKSGCPYCSGRKVGEDNNLQILFPEIAKEWHPTKNKELTPNNVVSKSRTKVWWLCPKGHSYETRISTRTSQKSGCHYCSGNKVGEDNNLLILFPEIAKEWHPTKNNDLTPKSVTYGARKKAWWLCPKGHSYESAITERTRKNGTGCPYCTKQTSEPEIRILSELKWLFDEVNSRYRIDGIEIDIFLPNYNLGIEYDGSFWHKDKEDSDLEKNEFLLSQNINLIRIRHHPLKPISKNDLIVKREILNKSDLNELLKKIHPFVDNDINEKINTYLEQPSFVNDELFNKYRSYFPSPFPENSLITTHPKLIKEWDYDKNYPLTPENFSFGANNKVWWICSKGHSYKTRIASRTSKDLTGCPYCAGKKASETNNLLKVFPEIAKEWHPAKNGKLTPEKVTYGSKKRVWWLCPKGHSYEAGISSRTVMKSGCSYCAGKKVSNENNFLILFPEIAKEWHPTKNGELTPDMVSYGSGKNIWWLCSEGHNFESTVNHRTRKSGKNCPYCKGKKTLNYG